MKLSRLGTRGGAISLAEKTQPPKHCQSPEGFSFALKLIKAANKPEVLPRGHDPGPFLHRFLISHAATQPNIRILSGNLAWGGGSGIPLHLLGLLSGRPGVSAAAQPQQNKV